MSVEPDSNRIWNRLSGALRRHWAAVVLIALCALMLTPAVLRMGAVLDDHYSLWVTNTKGLQETAGTYAQWTGRPLTSLAYTIDYPLLASHPWLAHLCLLAVHLLNASLLYVLALKLGVDRWTAVGIIGFWMLFPIQNETVFWFTPQNYLAATALILIAAIVAVSDDTTAQRRWLGIFVPAVAAIGFMEQAAPLAALVGIGLWAGWGRRNGRFQPSIVPWFAAVFAGGFLYLATQTLSGARRWTKQGIGLPPAFLEFVLGPLRRWAGTTALRGGIDMISRQPWVLLPALGLIVLVTIACRRAQVPDRERARSAVVVAALAVIGGLGPMLLIWLPGRAFYIPMAWASIGVVAGGLYLLREYAWLVAAFVMAIFILCSLGNAHYFIEANRVQAKYFAAFKRAMPELPADTGYIVARNAPTKAGTVAVMDGGMLGAALCNLYGINQADLRGRVPREPSRWAPGRVLQVWVREEPCPWEPDTVDFTAIWHPDTGQMRIVEGLHEPS